jgi:hypothetical protein
MSALDGSPALGILARHPLRLVSFERFEGRNVNGSYLHGRAELRVNTIRRWGRNFGETFLPGRNRSMSAAAGDNIESMRRSLIHETAHHVQEPAVPSVARSGVQ